MAGRKVFTSGEILTAADVNSYLMDQSVMVFADSSARSSAIPSPSEGMVTYREDANRVEVYDGSSFGPVGTILQVVNAENTAPQTGSVAATNAATITSLSPSITPSSTSSKILVTVDINGTAATAAGFVVTVLRDSTAIGIGDAAGSRSRVSLGGFGKLSGRAIYHVGSSILDSPNTTSAVTYTVEVRNVLNTTQTYFINRSGDDADNAEHPRSASRITLMEVAG